MKAQLSAIAIVAALLLFHAAIAHAILLAWAFIVLHLTTIVVTLMVLVLLAWIIYDMATAVTWTDEYGYDWNG